ncbi:MAG: CoA transferase, partial [Rhodobacterales bacterium]
GHLGLIAEAALTGKARGKSGNALYGAYGQDFVCSDGKRIMVIGLTERQWLGLVRMTGTEAAMARLADCTGRDLCDEGARFALRHDITGILKPWFAVRPSKVAGQECDKAGVTWSQFRSIPEALAEDPDLSEDNPMFRVLNHPGVGRYPVPGSPLNFSGYARTDPVPAPALGAHTEEILGDVVGLSDTEIAGLFDAGIVQSAAPRRSCRTAA